MFKEGINYTANIFLLSAAYNSVNKGYFIGILEPLGNPDTKPH
jgi:hypothetical protein